MAVEGQNATRYSFPARRREMTIFDLPPVGNPKFATNIRKPSISVFHRQDLVGNSIQTSRTKVSSPKAHLRLRELTEINLGSTRSLTDSELHKTAMDYVNNRSNSTSSWFKHNRQIIQANTQINDLKPEVRDAFTQLSIVPPISSRGEPMLRRPAILQPRPISEDGDIFRIILKNKELMPFSFQGDMKLARDFYASHYPLLMRKILDVSRPNSRRVSMVTEELAREFVRISSAERRSMKMMEKDKQLEEVLKGLEEESGGELVTELRDDVFYPMLWSLNKDK